MNHRFLAPVVAALLVATVALGSGLAAAQAPPFGNNGRSLEFDNQFSRSNGGSFGAAGGFGGGAGGEVISARAEFVPPRDGHRGALAVIADVAPGWHIYSMNPGDAVLNAATITVNPIAGVRVGEFRALTPPKREEVPGFDKPLELHRGEVIWAAPLEIAAGVNPSSLTITGDLKAQACDDANTQCMPPKRLPFSAHAASETSWFAAGPAWDDAKVGGSALDPEALRRAAQAGISDLSMLRVLLLAFFGGLILNIMPCVFPVIGLKVMSFVEQAGHDRRRALTLNLWYTAGMLLVFWLLAALAVGLGFGWGQLFTRADFPIALAAIVFAMALGFLGVWEIPLPGFVGRGAMVEAAEHEGAAGAVVKGALTTVLATPCTAPFLGAALTWAVVQPPQIVFLVFTAVGLGMASPYLLLGVFPELLRFLPRPGAWMDTFKQLLGFVLLGTVVFLLTFMEAKYVVPTVAFLFGIWLACWWIGKLEVTAQGSQRLLRWLEGAVIASAIGAFAFVVMMGDWQPNKLPWQPFTQAAFEQHIADDKTVLVDFTADWCATCKVLEATVLNTEKVRELVHANGVVALRADWTHEDPEVTELLSLLGAKQVPVVAIFPAGRPNDAIIFNRGGYSQSDLLKALTDAGPSRNIGQAGAPPATGAAQSSGSGVPAGNDANTIARPVAYDGVSR